MSWKMRKSGKRARLDGHVVLEVERGVYWVIGIGLVGWRVSGRDGHLLTNSCESLLVMPLRHDFRYIHRQAAERNNVKLTVSGWARWPHSIRSG